jgi:hypothetical protein
VWESYLAPEELVDAAFAGLDVGESVTIPSMLDEQPWTALEAARTEFVKAVMSGKIAFRYRSSRRGREEQVIDPQHCATAIENGRAVHFCKH